MQIILIILVCLFSGSVAGDEIEKEFELFFQEPLRKIKQVKFTMYAIQENAGVMNIRVNLNIIGITKVLILHPKNNTCSDDPVRVAGFTLNPKYKIPYIDFRSRSFCISGKATYLLYVKTKDNKYYTGFKNFAITYND